jgi:hypothetical protein
VYIEDYEGSEYQENEEPVLKVYDKPINAYQKISHFRVDLDLNKNKIYVFTKKDTANTFIRRFRYSKIIDYEYIYFDLTKIDELENLGNVFGAWQNGVGRCKKKAYFGTQINKLQDIIDDKEKVTSYNVEYEYNGEIVDLFISRDGKISTQSNLLTNKDLVNIFNYLDQELSKR